MRIFNAQLFDDRMEGSGAALRCSKPWGCLLSRAESLKFTCIVDQVSGTTPALTLFLSGTPMGGDDYEQVARVLMNNVALVSGTNLFALWFNPSDFNYPAPKHLFVHAALTGTNPIANVRLWVCGRGPQLLEQIPAVQPSFANQYAAARMLDDENRLPLQKRTLAQGKSLFYPPELFLPSLKWER